MHEMTITLYHFENNSFIKQIINNAFYYDANSADYTKTGLANDDEFKVNISTSEDINFTEGRDLVIKGICEFDFDNLSEETISKSLKELKSNYKIYTVDKATKYLFGGLSNIELTCK